ncbi:MAG: hypothetical protein R3F17_03810 [Planctomycetota bacterium]
MGSGDAGPGAGLPRHAARGVRIDLLGQRAPPAERQLAGGGYPAGYAREIDPDGRTVWEFHSPHRTGRQRELVAVLFDMQRLPADLDLSWTR